MGRKYKELGIREVGTCILVGKYVRRILI